MIYDLQVFSGRNNVLHYIDRRYLLLHIRLLMSSGFHLLYLFLFFSTGIITATLWMDLMRTIL